MLRSSIRLQDVRRLLRSAEKLELTAESVQRLKWFQFALEHACNVSLTCRHFGISRSTFLRWSQRFDAKDIATLEDESRRPHTFRKPKADDRLISAIAEIRKTQPLLGKEAIVSLLSAQGIATSASTVGRIITRHKLFFAETPAHVAKRSHVQSSDVEPEVRESSKMPSRTKHTNQEDADDGHSLLPATGFTS